MRLKRKRDLRRGMPCLRTTPPSSPSQIRPGWRSYHRPRSLAAPAAPFRPLRLDFAQFLEAVAEIQRRPPEMWVTDAGICRLLPGLADRAAEVTGSLTSEAAWEEAGRQKLTDRIAVVAKFAERQS